MTLAKRVVRNPSPSLKISSKMISAAMQAFEGDDLVNVAVGAGTGRIVKYRRTVGKTGSGHSRKRILSIKKK